MRRRIVGSIVVAATMAIAGCGSSSRSPNPPPRAAKPSDASTVANTYVGQQTQKAEQRTDHDPRNPRAWAGLILARYADASRDYDLSTDSYTATGKADLTAAARAWQRYLKLDQHPDPTLARIMGEVYQDLGDYTQEANAWEIAADASPKVASYWEYVALAAYLGKDTDLGNLAAAKALNLTPKAQRTALKAQFTEAKTEATSTTTTATTTT